MVCFCCGVLRAVVFFDSALVIYMDPVSPV